jgi:hypothetical protein
LTSTAAGSGDTVYERGNTTETQVQVFRRCHLEASQEQEITIASLFDLLQPLDTSSIKVPLTKWPRRKSAKVLIEHTALRSAFLAKISWKLACLVLAAWILYNTSAKQIGEVA